MRTPPPATRRAGLPKTLCFPCLCHLAQGLVLFFPMRTPPPATRRATLCKVPTYWTVTSGSGRDWSRVGLITQLATIHRPPTDAAGPKVGLGRPPVSFQTWDHNPTLAQLDTIRLKITPPSKSHVHAHQPPYHMGGRGNLPFWIAHNFPQDQFKPVPMVSFDSEWPKIPRNMFISPSSANW